MVCFCLLVIVNKNYFDVRLSQNHSFDMFLVDMFYLIFISYLCSKHVSLYISLMFFMQHTKAYFQLGLFCEHVCVQSFKCTPQNINATHICLDK